MQMTVRCVGFVLLAAAAVFGLGCVELPVPLADAEPAWDTMGVDRALAGDWRHDNEQVALTLHDDGYMVVGMQDQDDLPAMVFKTFEHAGVAFMLWVQHAAVESGFDSSDIEYARLGMIWQYRLDGDTMAWRILNFDVLEEAIESGAIAGSVEDDDEFGLASLDEPTRAWLADAFTEDDNIAREFGPIVRVQADEAE